MNPHRSVNPAPAGGYSAVMRRLLEAARLAPSADNCQPWTFCCRSRRLEVGYARLRVGPRSFGPLEPPTLIGAGALIENVLAAAEEMRCQVQRFESRLAPASPIYLDLTLGRVSADSTAIGRSAPLWLRHTNRHPFRRSGLSIDRVRQCASTTQGRAFAAVLNDRADIRQLAVLVNRGTAIRFRIRELHEWLYSSLRFSRAEMSVGDGLDLRTLCLPPGGGLLLRLLRDWRTMSGLNRLGAYRLLAKADSQRVEQAPAAVAIFSDGSSEGWLDGGRLLVRVWSHLNAKGIAVHPYYVVSDMIERLSDERMPAALMPEAETLRRHAERLLELGRNRRLVMLLRVGIARRASIPSRRLPLATLVDTVPPCEPV